MPDLLKVHFSSAESPCFIHIIGIIMCTVLTHVHMNNMPITAASLLFSLRIYVFRVCHYCHAATRDHDLSFADSERSIKDAFIFFSSCSIRFSATYVIVLQFGQSLHHTSGEPYSWMSLYRSVLYREVASYLSVAIISQCPL